MKCVQDLKTNSMQKVSDVKACELVLIKKTHKYIDKSTYKKGK